MKGFRSVTWSSHRTPRPRPLSTRPVRLLRLITLIHPSCLANPILVSPRRKKAADARFKNRGKRPAPVAGEDGEPSTKRPAKDPDAGLTPYQREVKRLESRSLKDEGYGTRPTLK